MTDRVITDQAPMRRQKDHLPVPEPDEQFHHFAARCLDCKTMGRKYLFSAQRAQYAKRIWRQHRGG